MLIGRHEELIDAAGGIAIPDEWRELLLGESGIVYARLDRVDRSICIVPKDVMEEEIAAMQGRSVGNPELNEALMVVGANVEQVRVDAEGRMRINPEMLKAVGIKDKAVLVGAVRMVKIYAKNPD